MKKFILSVIALVLLLSGVAQAATALQTRIDATAPGSFSTNFNTSAGYNRASQSGGIWIPSITNADSINQFSNRMAYDPAHGTIRFFGQAHGNDYGGAFINYTIATDTWNELAWPSAFQCQQLSGCGVTPFNHEWDHSNAVRPSDGLHLIWNQGGDRALAYTPSTNSWAQVGGVPGPNTVHAYAASSFAYFPNMAKWVFCVGDYGCWTLDPANAGFLGNNVSAWTYIACGTICWSTDPGQTFKDSDGGASLTLMTYDGVRGRLYVATGNVGFGFFNAAGTWTKVQNCPALCEQNDASMAADPVTGDIVLMSQGGGTTRMYAFNGTQWSGALPVSIPSQFNAVGGAFSVPSVSLAAPYNAIMFGVFTGTGNNGIFLYKHAAAAPDTINPTAPTSVVATVISSSQVDLSWTAATDNIAVANYSVERCSGASCSPTTVVGSPTGTTFSNTGLSPSTIYRWRIRAFDTSTNPGPYSSPITQATTAAPDTTAPTVPTNLLPTVISSSQINLAWTASTDAVGVTGYQVERCAGAGCVNFLLVGSPATNSFSDTGLTASTFYRYRVRALDAVPNPSGYSSIAQETTSAPSSGGTDFTTRCAAPGVQRCWGFDDNASSGIVPGVGNYASGNMGVFHNSTGPNPPLDGSVCNTLPRQNECPVIDTSVKASGAGSLKFTLQDLTGPGVGGQWYGNANATAGAVTFGQNSDFYYQWRQRFDTAMVNNLYDHLGGGGLADGFKHAIITQSDHSGCPSVIGNCRNSNTGLDMVMQNVNFRNYAQMYGNVAGTQYFPFEDGGGQFGVAPTLSFQNMRPSPYCLYAQQTGGGPPFANNFPPNGNCFGYFANEWMTFKVHVHLGAFSGGNYVNSTVEFWLGREGQPTVPVGRWVGNMGGDLNEPFGKIFLIPYVTNKSSSQTHATAQTWYDELIVSTQDIADPGGTVGVALVAPTNPQVSTP